MRDPISRLKKAQALFNRHDIRDGDDADKPYVLDPLRDDVPEGWQGLLQELVEDLVRLGWDCRLRQVKSKFGSLRFYVSQRDDATQDRIGFAEKRSAETCEDCGNRGNLLQENHWYSTLCEECRSRRRAERARK